jgi:probable HAF family extracellular repeat protein
MNNAGQVVGTYEGFTGSSAFITGPNGVGVTYIGVLGANRSSATGINNAGQVVGDSTTTDGSHHAFITGPNGMGMTDLGTLGGDYSSADGINDAAQVVGYSGTADGQAHAFITGPNGVGMIDLNSLVHLPGELVLEQVIDINNAGQVIAVATTIPAIPEPQSHALMLAGLVLTGVMVRHKRKADALEGVLRL